MKRRLAAILLFAACAACSSAPAPPAGDASPSENSSAQPDAVDTSKTVPYDLQAVDFVSIANGWVVGNDAGNNVSVVLRTADGGATWHVLVEIIGETLLGIDMVDDRTGWVVGAEGVVYKTEDGGRTWTPEPDGAWPPVYTHAPVTMKARKEGDIAPTINESVASIFFADDRTGWAVGDAPTGTGFDVRGLVLGTIDGGKTWTELKDASGNGAPFSINDVWFTSPTEGWAAGGNVENAEEDVLLHTADGGKTWERRPTGAAEYLRAVRFVDPSRGFVVGMTVDTVTQDLGPSKILATEDGGKTWTAVFTSPRSFFDVTFADANRGWAVGDRASIYATTDGGKTWRQQTRFTTTGSAQMKLPARPASAEARALRTVYARGTAAWAGGEGVILRRK
jgi:photosystem II stability/assembly factor-like uncharacterized protein